VREFFADFRKFLMRGNIVDLAVAVIIGVAFNAVVQSLVNDVVSPIIGAIFGKPNFSSLTFKLGDGVIRYGAFITALINFLIIAFVLYVILRAFTGAQRRLSGASEEEVEKSEKDVLVEIRDLLASQRGA
jgi:large conductance mechanosensitive channel